ncbi:MAG: 2,3-bisphosphoglycerate-dependent phosphoglycerate mutase, partial [Pseudomonadota bacterium]
DLTEQGVAEAKAAGRALLDSGFAFDMAFTSELQRAQRTLDLILGEMAQAGIPTERDIALNERDYGELSGLNKDDARAKWGAEQVHIWRRSFDTPPPGGESLKGTADRTLPYYRAQILPTVQQGKSVIVAAHGNSLRSIIMEIDKLSPEEIVGVEVATGVPIVYELNADGSVKSKVTLEHA